MSLLLNTYLRMATTSQVLLKKYKLNSSETVESFKNTSKSKKQMEITSSAETAKVKHKSQKSTA